MTYPASMVCHSVVDGVCQQQTVWCLSGIDLFVDLCIESPESTQAALLSSRSYSEAPGSSGDEIQAFDVPRVSPCDEPQHPAQSLCRQEKNRSEVSGDESRCVRQPHGEPSGSNVSRDSEDAFLMPATFQIEKSAEDGTRWPWDDGLEGQSPKVEPDDCIAKKLDDDIAVPAVVELRQPLLQKETGDDLDVGVEHLKDQHEGQFGLDEEPDKCSENCSWSPESEDYSWAPVDIDTCTDHDHDHDVDQEIALDTAGFQDEYEQDCASWRMSSHSIPDNSNDGLVAELEHETSPDFPIWLSSARTSKIDSFSEAEISAATQLLKMSCRDTRKEFSEQELGALKECVVCELALRNGYVSSLEGLSRMVDKIHSTLPGADMDICNTVEAIQPRKMEESWWSGDESYSPSIVGAKVIEKDRKRRFGSNSRTSLRNSEMDEESDWKVLDRPKKRQYKSMQELY